MKSYDAVLFVTPEYNRSVPAPLKKEGITGPPLAPIMANIALGLASVLMLLCNALSVLPGSAAGWYVAGILSLFVMAAVPLGLFFYGLGARQYTLDPFAAITLQPAAHQVSAAA